MQKLLEVLLWILQGFREGLENFALQSCHPLREASQKTIGEAQTAIDGVPAQEKELCGVMLKVLLALRVTTCDVVVVAL